MKTYEAVVIVPVKLTIADEALDRVDEDWINTFYNLPDESSIVSHLAYNAVVNDRRISMMDGWADMKDEDMVVEILNTAYVDDIEKLSD